MQNIDNACFYQCNLLAEVSIPDSVTHVGAYAFNATTLYTASETDLVYVGGWLVAVKNLAALETIAANTLLPSTVGIADNCFYQAKALVTVALPNSVQYLGKYAFYGCEGLKRFESGTGLRYIQEGAFAGCSGLTRALLKPGLLEIGSYAFYGCRSLSALTVPKRLLGIEHHSFSRCAALKILTLSDGTPAPTPPRTAP